MQNFVFDGKCEVLQSKNLAISTFSLYYLRL